MCLDNLSELVAAAKAAEAAVDDLRAFDESAETPPIETFSDAEIRTILKQRVADTEAALRALGFTPPPKRVNEGDAAAELVARGVTLPGTLPAQRGGAE